MQIKEEEPGVVPLIPPEDQDTQVNKDVTKEEKMFMKLMNDLTLACDVIATYRIYFHIIFKYFKKAGINLMDDENTRIMEELRETIDKPYGVLAYIRVAEKLHKIPEDGCVPLFKPTTDEEQLVKDLIQYYTEKKENNN